MAPRAKRAVADVAELEPNPRVVIGDNAAPVQLTLITAPVGPDPFDGVRVHIDDLLTEARNWADGTAIQTQAQADELSFLIDQLRKANQAADKVRTAAKKPHMDAAKAIDAKFRPLTDAVDRALAATKKTLAAWLEALEAKRQADAKAAAEAAQLAARQAQLARALADDTDLESQEAAAAATTAAEELAKGAKKVANAPVAATGGARAMTLRTYYTPRLTDRREALKHYIVAQPEAFEAFLLQLARADVQRGIRTIPGVALDEDRRPV